MVLSMIPAYAMTGQVVMNEAHATSWDDLVAQFGGAEANKVVIPEDTTVYVDNSLACKNGSFTITGGGTLKRGDSFSGSMFRIIRDGNVTMDNIIIDGASNGLSGKTNSAVSMSDNASLSLINGTVIKNNNADSDGGAINNYYGDIYIGAGCKIEGNSSPIRGSAIAIIHGNTGSLTIDGAEISNNNGGYAIHCTTIGNDTGHDSYTITNTKITNNNGGGIELAKMTSANTYDVTLQDCEISGNTAYSGAGLYVSTGFFPQMPVTIKGCTFENNIADSDGGAIYSNSSIMLENTNIMNNTATNGKGGGIFGSYYDITHYIKGGLIENNKDNDNTGDNVYMSQGIIDLSEGATINGSITAKNIYLQGLVFMEGKIFKAGKYTITGPLDEKSVIEIGKITTEGNLISGTDGTTINTNEVYTVAVPAAGYTISEQDFSCFKINGKSGHPEIEENYLGLYMSDELSSLDNWAAFINSGEIAAWKGSFTINWDENNYYNYNPPQTTTIATGEKITLPQDPVDTIDKKEFTGWFTERVGGTQVTEGMVYTKLGNSTYYAQWKEHVENYSIYGIVTASKEPVPDVKIELYEISTTAIDGMQLLETATTDESGRYEFEGISNGNYKLKVYYGNTNREREVFINNSDMKHDFDYISIIIKTFKVYGNISNFGSPLSGVDIELYEMNAGAIDGMQLLETTTSNTRGYYEFKNKPNGKYVVKVNFGEGKEQEAIIVGANKKLDFEMATGGIATFGIYGNVKNDKGQVLENVEVNLLDSNTSNKLMNTVTDTSGSYKFENLLNGSYIVEAIGADGKATKTAAITNSNVEVYLEIASNVSASDKM